MCSASSETVGERPCSWVSSAVAEGLAAVEEPAGEVLDQGQVQVDQLVAAQRAPVLAGAVRVEHREQLRGPGPHLGQISRCRSRTPYHAYSGSEVPRARVTVSLSPSTTAATSFVSAASTVQAKLSRFGGRGES